MYAPIRKDPGIVYQTDTEVRLILPVPPSVNHYWGHSKRGVYLLPAGVQFKDDVLKLLGQLEKLEGEIGLSWTVYRARRSGDLDNFSKALQDSLQGLLFHNDSQIVETHSFRRDDKNDPRVELTAWTKHSKLWNRIGSFLSALFASYDHA